jgi:hypothetical protein
MAFDGQGNYAYRWASWEMFAAIAAQLAPEDVPAATRK